MILTRERIEENYKRISDRVFAAALKADRDPEMIRIVVVTKSQPVEVIQAVIDAGVKYLGENYPDETEKKVDALNRRGDFEWHMIGHLQSRKAKIVADYFQCMHSIDNIAIAEKLDRLLAERGKTLPVMLEFNMGGEETKAGWDAKDPSRWNELLPQVEIAIQCKHLDVVGLMTMPPLSEDAEKSRLYFRNLRLLRDMLMHNFPQMKLSQLSMGTSTDFEAAVEEGATYIRIGTAIVGPRKY